MTPTIALLLYALTGMTALTIEIAYTYATQGFGFGLSSNRPAVTKTPLGLRVERAWRNHAESAGYVLPMLAAAAVLQPGGADVGIALTAIVVGRAIFVPLYYTGLPAARIVGFSAASLGSLWLTGRMLGVI